MRRLLLIAQLKYKWTRLYLPLAVFDAILIFLAISAANQPFFISLSIITAVPLFFKPKYLAVTILTLALILLVYFLTKQSPEFGVKINGEYRITRVVSMGFVIEVNHNNVLVNTREKFHLYDIVKVIGTVSEVKNFGDFDLKTYLKGLNVFAIVDWPKLTLLGATNDFRVQAVEYVSHGGEWYEQITPLLLLGERTDASKEIYGLSLDMNVVHLLVISGFQISLFYVIIYKPLVWLKLNKKIAAWVPLLPVWIYLFLLGFPVSALRAGIFTTVMVLNKQILKNKFTTLEVLCFVFGLMTIIDPLSAFSLSFIMSFMATFVIVFISGISFKRKIFKYISLTFGAYFANVFIVMEVNHTFAVFGVLFGVLLTPIFIIMYLLTVFLFPAKMVLDYIDYAFIFIIKAFHTINLVLKVNFMNLQLLYAIYGTVWSSFIMISIWNFSMAKKTI